jgi:hypothetical protein
LPPLPMLRKVLVKDWTTSHTLVPARRERSLTRFVADMPYRVEFAARAARDLEILFVEKNAAESPAAAGGITGWKRRYMRWEYTPVASLLHRRPES